MVDTGGGDLQGKLRVSGHVKSEVPEKKSEVPGAIQMVEGPQKVAWASCVNLGMLGIYVV